MTDPRNMPITGTDSLDCGKGDNIATGRPYLVIVTGSVSSRICPIIRRHLVLNSVAVTVFTALSHIAVICIIIVQGLIENSRLALGIGRSISCAFSAFKSIVLSELSCCCDKHSRKFSESIHDKRRAHVESHGLIRLKSRFLKYWTFLVARERLFTLAVPAMRASLRSSLRPARCCCTRNIAA